mgnify:CR=1 FL=1
MSTYSSLFNQQVEVVEQKDVVPEDEGQEDAEHEDEEHNRKDGANMSTKKNTCQWV